MTYVCLFFFAREYKENGQSSYHLKSLATVRHTKISKSVDKILETHYKYVNRLLFHKNGFDIEQAYVYSILYEIHSASRRNISCIQIWCLLK